MDKILVTGGKGRFSNELKKLKTGYKFIFRSKTQLNILLTYMSDKMNYLESIMIFQ